jgi:hypothetical protein
MRISFLQNRNNIQTLTAVLGAMEVIMKKISALAAVLLMSTIIGGPGALAQTTGTPNSGAGVQGLPGNKSGPAAKPEQNPSGQSSGVSQDQSKVPGLPGNKSGPAPEKAAK